MSARVICYGYERLFVCWLDQRADRSDQEMTPSDRSETPDTPRMLFSASGVAMVEVPLLPAFPPVANVRVLALLMVQVAEPETQLNRSE
jgi:hypothetical protein